MASQVLIRLGGGVMIKMYFFFQRQNFVCLFVCYFRLIFVTLARTALNIIGLIAGRRSSNFMEGNGRRKGAR